MARRITKSMFRRSLTVVLCLCVCLGGVTSGRLVWLMLVKGDFYKAKAAQQQLYDREIAARRGDILDRNGNVLATSAAVWTLYALPNRFGSDGETPEETDALKREISETVGGILSVGADEILEKLNRDTGYVMLAKKIGQEQADRLRAYIRESDAGLSKYLGLDEGTKRFYSDGHLASVILGFVGDDNRGLGGLELQYDTELSGVPGRIVAARQANGTDMPFTRENTVEAQPGRSLVLTVDSYIQSVCEKYLEQGIADNAVTERAAAICMNVNTGAVLAMAVKGDYDLNDPFALGEADQAVADALAGDERAAKIAELQNRQWRNKAVSDPYEPGSVFKVVTASAAIEENVTDSTKSYFCPGYIVIAGHRYNCSKRAGHGTQNLTQGFQNSCNPVFITFGQQLGALKFSKYFKAFGLTEKTGIDLPGEADSLYYPAEQMGMTELASASFGQTFSVTPIQLITAVCAAVNGGKLMRPYLVDELIDENGETVRKTEPVVRRQAVSAETSAQIRVLMEKVVDGGGGKNAYIPGYRIGGKTGTSEKIAKMNQTGEQGLYISSFCGVAPIDDPEIALLVLFDEPHGSSYYGSTVAAPVCADIFSEILPYLGHEPAYSGEDLEKLAVAVPDVTGKRAEDARLALEEKELVCRVVGDGATVARQNPASGRLYKAGTVVLYTDADAQAQRVAVPDFTGMRAEQARAAAESAGLNVLFSGADTEDDNVGAYKQSVPAGEQAEIGSVVTVYFRSDDSRD